MLFAASRAEMQYLTLHIPPETMDLLEQRVTPLETDD
jgi:hypothetical protein